MIITNSLGSNYTAEDVKRALSLLSRPSQAAGASGKLQSDLANMFGVSPQHISLFYKGRQALASTLEKLGVGPGDQVIIQTFTCAVLPEAVLKRGATPVYADVARRSLNSTLASIKKAATNRTKALILQHTLGFVNQETEDIVTWCKEKKMTVIQDLTHAFGAPGLQKFLKVRPWRAPRSDLLRQHPIILSFSQDKVIDSISGGALITSRVSGTTNDAWPTRESQRKLLLYPLVTSLIRSTYDLGIGKGIHFLAKLLSLLPSPLDAPQEISGLPEPLAALALAQLRRLPNISKHRRAIAHVYDEFLHDKFKIVSGLDIERGANLRYPIWVENRDELENRLKRQNFCLLDHWYDSPVSPSWRPASVSYRQGSCPNAEELSRHIFNLPTHVNIQVDQAEHLSRFINDTIEKPYKI